MATCHSSCRALIYHGFHWTPKIPWEFLLLSLDGLSGNRYAFYSQKLENWAKRWKISFQTLDNRCVPWEKRVCEVALEQEEGPQRVLMGGDANGLEFAEQRKRESGAAQGKHPGSPLRRPLYLRQVFICTSVPAHVLCAFAVCHQKLIGWPKKELENFIQAEFENYNLGRESQKTLRTILIVRSQDINLYAFFFLRQRVVYQMLYYWQLT